jgi:hypothetical protein
MATSFTLTVTTGPAGGTFVTGAANGAASDLVAINTLMNLVDTIVGDLGSAYRANGSSFNAQGLGAGSMAGQGVLTSIAARMANTRFQLQQLNAINA